MRETTKARRASEPPGQLEALMEAAQRGDAAAYDEVLRAVLPMLRSVARRRLSDPTEVEEAVQDTLLTMHVLRHTYEPGRPLRPWLVVMCERRCFDRLRWRHRHARGEMPISEADGELRAAATEDVAPRHVLREELRAIVDSLPRVQRLALRLTKLEDLSLAEASARTGVSIGALKVACFRGVRTLRQRLAEAA